MPEFFDPMQVDRLMKERRYDEAIAYADRFRELDPDDPRPPRFAALARGGKGEHVLASFDQMGVLPTPDRLDALVALFHEATEIDPTLADPFWDLAVLHARFLNRPATARAYLEEARALGYDHPMMPVLEQMLVGQGQ